jgi:hypothetical protein
VRSIGFAACVILLAAGCSGSGDHPTPTPTSQHLTPGFTSSATAPAPSAGSTSPAENGSPFQPETVARPGPGQRRFYRAGDGSTLVSMQTVALGVFRTRYRIYDHEWSPRTPLLEVPASLEILRQLPVGFIARTTSRNLNNADQHVDETGRATPHPILRSWVLMRSDGSVHELVTTHRDGPPHRTDVLFSSPGGVVHAYRPSTGEVWQADLVASAPPQNRSWVINPDGSVCVPERGERSAPTAWSPDGGHTWANLRLSDVLPADASTHPAVCALHRGRLVVAMDTGDGFSDIYTVPTSNPSSWTHLLLGGDVNPNSFATLPDGRVLLQSRKHRALYIGTDSSNSTVQYRAGPPSIQGAYLTITETDMIRDPGSIAGVKVSVSEDEAVTWRPVDLEAGGWALGG